MTPSIARVCATAAGLVLGFGLQGCRDTDRLASAPGAAARRTITPHVIVAPDGASAVLTLALDVHGDVGRIGSFTGRLRFDATQLAYDGEVPLTDGTMRASNPGEGVIRIAGASLSGVDVAQLASFRFKVINAAGLSAVQFDIEEVHELSRANVTALVVRSGATGTRR